MQKQPVLRHTAKGQVRYRYYASRRKRDDKRPGMRVTAETIEQAVLEQARGWLQAALRHHIHSNNIEELSIRSLTTVEESSDTDEHRDDIISEISVPFRPERWVRDRRDVYGAAPAASPDRNTHALLKLVRKAFDAQNLVLENPATSLAAIAASQKMDRRQLGRLVKLSWLSPSIIERIHPGSIPPGLTRSRLLEADLLLDWEEQERVLGFC